MSEESALAPGQKLGVWIMSGSLALVAVIGGGVAINSADKSVEEGNPAPNQTVAPGGGHTPRSAESEDLTGPSPSHGTGKAGVLGLELAYPGTAVITASGQQPTAPGVVAQNAARAFAQGVHDQTSPVRLTASTPPAAGRVPEVADKEEPNPTGADAEPTVSDHGAAAAFRSETGNELQVGFFVPDEPGDYSFTVSVDDQPFTVHVRVAEDGQVTFSRADGMANPYRYDSITGRATATLVPADFGSAERAFAPDARIKRIKSSSAVETTRTEAASPPRAPELAYATDIPASGAIAPRPEAPTAQHIETSGSAEKIEYAEKVQYDKHGRPDSTVEIKPNARATTVVESTAAAVTGPRKQATSAPPFIEMHTQLERDPTHTRSPRAKQTQRRVEPTATRTAQPQQTHTQPKPLHTGTTPKQTSPVVSQVTRVVSIEATPRVTDPAEDISTSTAGTP